MNNTRLNYCKPTVTKHTLLLIAAIVWTMAGIMLLGRGSLFVIQFSSYKIIRFVIALLFGIGFFKVLFAKISLKHINRIKSLDIERPCLFSFFSLKSYLMMGLMITLGILLRKSSFVNKDILYTFYVGMGIPLLISAGRFYYAWFIDRKS